ncbi:MAG: hypothetical protein ACRYG8_02985 [Janthinobacterium lividum]
MDDRSSRYSPPPRPLFESCRPYLVASSRDDHAIDQKGRIDGLSVDAANAFGLPNLVVNFSLIENTAPNGIAIDIEGNALVLNAGTIEAAGTGGVGVGVRIVSRLPAGSRLFS